MKIRYLATVTCALTAFTLPAKSNNTEQPPEDIKLTASQELPAAQPVLEGEVKADHNSNLSQSVGGESQYWLTLDEISIGADMLGRSKSEVAASVERLDAETIKASATYSYHDLLGSLANVTQAQSNRQVSIRGVLQNGNAAGDNPLISVYLDGIALPARAASFGGPLSAFDIESVEVVRGPQSTSRGRNSLAGAVYLNTPDARPEWHGKVQYAQASHHGEQIAAVIGGPVVNDNLAFRLNYEERNTDGDITNVTRNEDDAGRTYTETAKLKLAYQNPNSIYSNNLSYIWGDNSFGDNLHDASNGERTESASERYDENYRSNIFAFDQRWLLGEFWSIQSQTGFARGRNYRDADFDRSEADGGTSTFQLDDDQFTQEVRFHRNTLSRSVIGAYYSYGDQLSIVTGDDAVAGGGTVALDGFVEGTKQIRSYALFAEHEQPFADNWAWTLGLRFDNENRKRHVFSDVSYSPACPPGAPAGCNAAVPDGLIPDPVIGVINATGVFPLPEDYDERGETTDRVLLPKAVLRWDYANTHNVAISYQQGYRSGGTSISFFGGEVNNYSPEYTENYEIALRDSWLDGRVTLDTNVFYIKWRDQQVEVGNSRDYFTVIENAGRSHLYGLELSGQWFVNSKLSLSSSIGLLKTEYDEFENLDEDYAGNEFNYAPNETANLAINWQPNENFTANLGASYTGEYFSDPSNNPEEVIPERTLYNARLSWQSEYLELFVFGRNLTDEENIQDSFVVRDRPVRRYGESRILGAGLIISF